MRKTRIHGKIENKFIIKNKENGLTVMENIQIAGHLSFMNYPAVFNTKEEAEKYLSSFELSEEEKRNLIIECTDISFFNNGGILVEMNED